MANKHLAEHADKQAPPQQGRIRVCFDIPRTQHRQLKAFCRQLGMTQREFVIQLLEKEGIGI